eukprot:NODE_1326_length_1004_cov_59.930890_g1022_i0.p2 GENE.NODE_1326_length_1004_cov_59.930890_g1022_i0~~NODE_1326_length_1004_cov_59.930890_g1022_i0.p2  ORF type:complete len:179 (+),score=66.14 NODE_1326_length_1004_cov_59.930890_g1022_i0:72-608(+)
MGALLAKLRELFMNSSLNVVLVGVEGSGKTTLTRALGGSVEPYDGVATVGLDIQNFKAGKTEIRCCDVGGQERNRNQWGSYCDDADVIVYVVDAADMEKMPTASRCLHNLMEDEHRAQIPLLIALNKIDLTPHLTKDEAAEKLRLSYLEDCHWLVMEISALKQTNLKGVLEWLVKHAK